MVATVLVLTSIEDASANLVISALNRRGTPVARVDPADIGPDLTIGTTIGGGTPYWTGRLRTPSREVDLGQVKSVYHRRPGLGASATFPNTNDLGQARAFAAAHGPVVYKTFRGVPPSADGRAGVIWTQRIDPETLDAAVRVTAHLFQSEIPKCDDVRVTVVGHRVFAQRIATPEVPSTGAAVTGRSSPSPDRRKSPPIGS